MHSVIVPPIRDDISYLVHKETRIAITGKASLVDYKIIVIPKM